MRRLMTEIHVSAKYEINILMWRRMIQYVSPFFYCYYYNSGVQCYDNKIMDIDSSF